MTPVYSGGCACGAIRYEIKDKPFFESHCQCRDCQRRSGTGHGSYVTFADRAKVTVTGDVRTWRVAGDSGNVKIFGFCGTCGTPVSLTSLGMPSLFSVPAASLDAPERFQPSVVMYNVRALKWDAHDPQLVKLEKMPPA